MVNLRKKPYLKSYIGMEVLIWLMALKFIFLHEKAAVPFSRRNCNQPQMLFELVGILTCKCEMFVDNLVKLMFHIIRMCKYHYLSLAKETPGN